MLVVIGDGAFELRTMAIIGILFGCRVDAVHVMSRHVLAMNQNDGDCEFDFQR
jgi:hypothetical protein